MLIGGAEYNGLIASGCYQRGEISCVSCHSMHDSDPDDQLAAGMEGDRACLQCHQEMEQDLSRHTHHRAESSGSRCYNCHMPHTSYAPAEGDSQPPHRLAQRGGQARGRAVPTPATNATSINRSAGPPIISANGTVATRKWKLPGDEAAAASIVWLLKGNALERSLAAWTMGWRPALEASGDDWQAPYLIHLLDDPYPPVRYIAARSLKRLSGYSQLNYGFARPVNELTGVKRRLLDEWKSRPPPRVDERLLLGADGIDWARFLEMAKQRDDTPISVQE